METSRSLLFFIVVLATFGCREHAIPLPQRLQAELDHIVSSKFDWTPGVNLSVYAPDDSLFWTGSAGVSDLEGFADFTLDQPFRIASVTKTFVAATVLRLHESGRLSIDDPISAYLTAAHRRLLIQDGYRPDLITLRQCLNHTSGLYDYVFGTKEHPSPFFAIIRAEPQKRWTRTDLLQGAVEWGDPLWPAGAGFSYGDTGYIILGAIIERATGLPLGDALESVLDYAKLDLTSTWLESVQPPRSDQPLVACYFRRENFSRADPSMDLYGGGGLVSTTRDLSRFFYHLFNGGVFADPSTLELMAGAALGPEEIMIYQSGIRSTRVLGGVIHGHGGLWDTFAYYSPEKNTAFALHFTDGGSPYLIKRVVTLLNEYLN